MKKTNVYIVNIINELLNILIPFFTVTYTTRILGVDAYGNATLALTMADTFIIFSSLGIPIYGIRVIASNYNNREETKKNFIEILLINLITATISTIVFYLMIYNLQSLQYLRSELLVTSLAVFFSFINIEWYLRGTENYSVILFRNIIIKVLSIVLIFTLIHSSEDLIKYLWITIGLTVLQQFLNFLAIKNQVRFNYKNINLKRHIKPLINLFSTRIASLFYKYVDKYMLGFTLGSAFVGYYTISDFFVQKLIILVSVFNQIQYINASKYITEGQHEKNAEEVKNSFDIIYFLTMPMAMGCILYGKEIAIILGGSDFELAKYSIAVLSLLIPIICFSGITGMQILYPHKKESIVLKSMIFGTIVNVALNIIFIPKYAHMGASIASVIAQLVILIIQYIYIRKEFSYYKNINMGWMKKIYIVFIWFIIAISLKIVVYVLFSNITYIFISIPLSIAIYIFVLYIGKIEIIVNVINDLMKKYFSQRK